MALEGAEVTARVLNALAIPEMDDTQKSQLLPIAVTESAIICASIASRDTPVSLAERIDRMVGRGDIEVAGTDDFYEKVLSPDERRFVGPLSVVFGAVAALASKEAENAKQEALSVVYARY